MKKYSLVIALTTLCLASQISSAREAQELYNKSCIACHSTGAAGAPKTGDAAAWAPKLAKGEEVLLANVKKGFKAMPPKGMCMDCTDEEFKGLINFMSVAK